ncbi:hypothetical protein [Spongorhabdus nitratireducens]
MKIKTTLLPLAIAMGVAIGSTAQAAYEVQPVVKQDIVTDGFAPTLLQAAKYEVQSKVQVERTENDGITVSDIVPEILEVRADGILLKLTNRTMRRFMDINLDIDGSGITLNQPLDDFTELQILVKDITPEDSSDITFLDPDPLFNPNSHNYSELLSSQQILAYHRIQNNFKVAYGRAANYERYLDYFTNERDEPRRNAWAKWFRTMTYDIPKAHKVTAKTGVASGSWLAVGGQHLDKVVTQPNYTGAYAFYSHEYAHTMGFKHWSGMAYGWDGHAGSITFQTILDELTSNETVLPTTNNYFWHYDKEQGLRLYARNTDGSFSFDRVDIIYDTDTTKVGATAHTTDTITLPMAARQSDFKILINAEVEGKLQSVNLILDAEDIGVASPDEFEALVDTTPAEYEKREIELAELREQMKRQFPASDLWTSDPVSNPLTFKYKSQQVPVCKFQEVKQGLKVITLFGYVAEERCTIGEDNAYKGEKGLSSASFQMVATDDPDLAYGNLKSMVTQRDQVMELCFHSGSDENYDGLGFKNNDNGRCEASMTNAGGKNWSERSSTHTMLDTGKLRPLPESPYWGAPGTVDQPLVVSTRVGDKTLCRFSYKLTQEFGFVTADNQCSIGENNSLEGIKGFASDEYQVVDAAAGAAISGERIPVPLHSGQTGSLCYRDDSHWVGASFSLDNRGCGKWSTSNKRAANGRGYGFSRGNNFPTFSF